MSEAHKYIKENSKQHPTLGNKYLLVSKDVALHAIEIACKEQKEKILAMFDDDEIKELENAKDLHHQAMGVTLSTMKAKIDLATGGGRVTTFAEFKKELGL